MHSSVEKKSTERKPEWEPDNFRDHYRKHLNDEDCLKMYPPSRSGKPISEDEYRELSRKAVDKSWAEATFYHRERNEYRRFYADGDLILAITSDGGKYYITCYHKHLESYAFSNNCKAMMKRTEDDRKESFKRWVEDMENDGRWLKVNWKRGGK